MTAKLAPPAAVRNAPFLIDVLRRVMPADGLVLEIASGSGYHAAAFARAFPHLRWQPSEPEPAARASIAAHVDDAGAANLLPPLALDVLQSPWPVAHADAVVCINMMHISPWRATEALFAGAARLLDREAPLLSYGPYILHGDFIAESNVAFDASLKARNPEWGLREVDDVAAAAAAAGLRLDEIVPMPANNLSLIFRRG